MPDATVTATWAGGFSAHYALEDRVLQPGDEAQVPVREAVDSDNWKVVGGKKAIDAAFRELARLEAATTQDDDGEPKPPTVAELKEQLKALGLPTTGKRAELEERLAARLAEGDQPDAVAGDGGDPDAGGAGDETSTGGEA